jgi:hypothetical protein
MILAHRTTPVSWKVVHDDVDVELYTGHQRACAFASDVSNLIRKNPRPEWPKPRTCTVRSYLAGGDRYSWSFFVPDILRMVGSPSHVIMHAMFLGSWSSSIPWLVLAQLN